jgi:predicted ABC-type ATPase
MMHPRSTPPTVYVIAGPNGAGKTTFAARFLPDFVDCRHNDSSRLPPALIAWEESGSMTISDPDLFRQILRSVGE